MSIVERVRTRGDMRASAEAAAATRAACTEAVWGVAAGPGGEAARVRWLGAVQTKSLRWPACCTVAAGESGRRTLAEAAVLFGYLIALGPSLGTRTPLSFHLAFLQLIHDSYARYIVTKRDSELASPERSFFFAFNYGRASPDRAGHVQVASVSALTAREAR